MDVFELQAPSKTIATMQITRDLRSEKPHNLSTLFSTIPKEILDACQSARANNTKVDLDSIPTIPDPVLDLDIKEELANLRNYKELITEQKKARQKIINLLYKSRCQFGAREIAEMYYSMDDVEERLQKRKAIVLDAMELEGLDVDGTENSADENIEKNTNRKEFSWYSRSEAQKVGLD